MYVYIRIRDTLPPELVDPAMSALTPPELARVQAAMRD
jgi:hypothetical protein